MLSLLLHLTRACFPGYAPPICQDGFNLFHTRAPDEMRYIFRREGALYYGIMDEHLFG